MVYKWLINNLSYLSDSHCQLCDQRYLPVQSQFVCNACLHDLPRFFHACRQCGIDVVNDQQSTSLCGQCSTAPPSYDRVIALFAYAEPIRHLVARFKYERQLAIGSLFAELLSTTLQARQSKVDAILPVPLHPARLRQRGFNQALELARPVARALGLPLLTREVRRCKNTLEQASLSGKQRRANLRQAFVLNRPIDYRSVAVVDDVMTTGSTVEELSHLLKQNGVEYVEIWSVARAGQS